MFNDDAEKLLGENKTVTGFILEINTKMEPPNIASSVLSNCYVTRVLPIWIPPIIPQPEPPDRISASLSPPIIHCAATEKSTQVEFTSGTTIIDFHLIHNFKVTLYPTNCLRNCLTGLETTTQMFAKLSKPTSNHLLIVPPPEPPDIVASPLLNLSLVLTGTECFTENQCHNIAAYRLISNTLQVFDQMAKGDIHKAFVDSFRSSWQLQCYLQELTAIKERNGSFDSFNRFKILLQHSQELEHELQLVHTWSYLNNHFHVGCLYVLANIHCYLNDSARKFDFVSKAGGIKHTIGELLYEHLIFRRSEAKEVRFYAQDFLLFLLAIFGPKIWIMNLVYDESRFLPHDPWYVEIYVNSILDFLNDWVCKNSNLMSCPWSNIVHSAIPSSKNDGCKSHNHEFFLCFDSWINFAMARIFVSFDKSAIFWVLLKSFSHDNIQIESMYSHSRDYYFETHGHRDYLEAPTDNTYKVVTMRFEVPLRFKHLSATYYDIFETPGLLHQFSLDFNHICVLAAYEKFEEAEYANHHDAIVKLLIAICDTHKPVADFLHFSWWLQCYLQKLVDISERNGSGDSLNGFQILLQQVQELAIALQHVYILSFLNIPFNGDYSSVLVDHHCYLDHNARLIDDVAFTLDMLVRNYGFMPNVDNFLCIVNKLDIHGRKNEVKRVIYGIQFGECSKMCGSLSITYATYGYFTLERMVASLLLKNKYTKSFVYALAGFENEANLDNKKNRDFIAPSKYVHRVCLDHWLSVKKEFAFACCSTCMATYDLCLYLAAPLHQSNLG